LVNALLGLFSGIVLVSSGDPSVLPIGAIIVRVSVLIVIFSIGL
jgi:hypothetical protein